jgi:NAD(P)-dependent dehydrogenase (short-subunit alcohol dehydrogenase family)/acyl carrier protein
MGGIGRALAIWMVKHGAKNIAFTSRSGLTQPNAKEIKAHLESLGAKVKVLACDISSASALRAALDNIAHDMPPIKGVMQLALVIKNALFANTTLHETWAPSLKPKIAGTWNLHNLLPKDMDFFILYSSMVGVFGNEGQAAYGAASAFQDAFANHRNAVGLPATCIDLGMVTGVGYVAERTDLQRNLQERGFEGISEDECMAIIESAIMAPKRDAGLDAAIMTGVGLVDFAKGGSSSTRPFYHTPKFSHFRRMAFSSSSSSSNDESGTAAKVRDLLKAATDFAEAIQVIVDAVLRKIGSLLMVPAEDLSAARAMADYGMDSLVAVEMRNWITRDLEVTVPILELLGSVSINDLCKNIAKQSKLVLKKEEVE